jgi:hypothetical protein
MGREVCSLDYIPYLYSGNKKLGHLQHLLGMGPGIWRYNRDLLALATKYHPDVFWVDKGTTIQPSTLQTIKRRTGAIFAVYNTDYLGCNTNPWRLHLPGIHYYDLCFTTNRLDIQRIRDLGAGNVSLVLIGYHREIHKPVPITSEEVARLGASVGFIGHWEPATEDLMLRLLELGLTLRVRGTQWHHARHKKRLVLTVEPRPVYQDEYAKAVLATKINLGINSAQNKNQHSGRSFEIPAIGGFLLAERTLEHQALYEEGKEAEFFASAEELVEKANYYLKHEEERQQIAKQGHVRCISRGYSMEEIMGKMVNAVEQVRGLR